MCKNWWFYQVDFYLRRVKVLLRFWFYLYGTFCSLLRRIKNQEMNLQFLFHVVEIYQFYLQQSVAWKFVSHEFIFRWPLIKFFEYVRRSWLNPIRSSFSVSEDSERKDSFDDYCLGQYVHRKIPQRSSWSWLSYFSFFYPYFCFLL